MCTRYIRPEMAVPNRHPEKYLHLNQYWKEVPTLKRTHVGFSLEEWLTLNCMQVWHLANYVTQEPSSSRLNPIPFKRSTVNWEREKGITPTRRLHQMGSLVLPIFLSRSTTALLLVQYSFKARAIHAGRSRFVLELPSWLGPRLSRFPTHAWL